jgi:hypothetical protein
VRQQRKGRWAEVEGRDHEAAAEVSEVGRPPPCFVIGSNQAAARSGSGEGRGRSPPAGCALVRCGRARLDAACVQLGGHDCGRRASTTALCHSGVKGGEERSRQRGPEAADVRRGRRWQLGNQDEGNERGTQVWVVGGQRRQNE